MLKLMYITNDVNVASIAQSVGVDRIFIDLEKIGKASRQNGLDTVMSSHNINDILKIKEIMKSSDLLVRCNPIHTNVEGFLDSKEEIDQIIKNGADIVMLPFFKTIDEVRLFLKYVNKRSKTMLLFETKESIKIIDEILNLDGIDEVFIGLNDLSISLGRKFMFELLSDGTVEWIVDKFKEHNLVFGFGGIASLGNGLLPSEKIIMEHYRLGSSSAILSRSFCNLKNTNSLNEIEIIFQNGLFEIRNFEKRCKALSKKDFERNKNDVKESVKTIVTRLN